VVDAITNTDDADIPPFPEVNVLGSRANWVGYIVKVFPAIKVKEVSSSIITRLSLSLYYNYIGNSTI
jgi:hypothetical protein